MLLLFFLLAGCLPPAAGRLYREPVIPANSAGAAGEPTRIVETAIPAVTAASEPQGKTSPTPTSAAVEPRLWIADSLPGDLQSQLSGLFKLVSTHPPVRFASGPEEANLRIEIAPAAAGQDWPVVTRWVYALAAPFPTVTDGVSLEDLQKAWNGDFSDVFQDRQLLMSAETLAVFERYWGPPDQKSVKVADEESLLELAWQEQTAWAVIPFEAIEPRWKVLRVDGQSPLEKAFDPETYPLAIPVYLHGEEAALQALPRDIHLTGNRDPDRLTTLTMTGVTALSRHIGERMESNGVTYPAQDIGPLLAQADLTHISNEVSFFADCPTPGPLRADMRFCSHPKYIELLETAGADIIELTGNHNLDWGVQPYLDTLEMYRERGWMTFGGGANLSEAEQPLLIEHNGNRLAFIGCSPAGPEPVWATADKPGSAPCNFDKLEGKIRQLRDDGYLPVVTLQHIETDGYLPSVAQGMPDFRRLARAGAVIVSGSQSHYPQTMTFVGSHFVHYGLGNLFFDQMEPEEIRAAFIDQHTFYDGRYLGVNLVTALLEDYAKPREMSPAERSEFLETIFSLCRWNDP